MALLIEGTLLHGWAIIKNKMLIFFIKQYIFKITHPYRPVTL